MIFDIQRGLKDVPGALDVRRHTLKTAIDGLNQVSRFSQESQVDRNTAAALVETGDVLMRLAGTEEDAVSTASLFYDQAHDTFRKLADADPHDAQAQRDLSISCNKLGSVTLRLGQTDAAEVLSGRSGDREEAGGVRSPRCPAQRDLSASYSMLGDLMLRLGQPMPRAEALSGQSGDLQEPCRRRPPRCRAQRELSISYEKLGNVALQLGQPLGALKYYRDSLAIRRNLADAGPRDARCSGTCGSRTKSLET